MLGIQPASRLVFLFVLVSVAFQYFFWRGGFRVSRRQGRSTFRIRTEYLLLEDGAVSPRDQCFAFFSVFVCGQQHGDDALRAIQPTPSDIVGPESLLEKGPK